MKRITECKVSLLEKPGDFAIDTEGQGNYIMKTTGTFYPEKYLEQWAKGEDPSEKDYEDFIHSVFLGIYENLLEQKKDEGFDSVGIWITFEDGEKIDNAMDLSVLESFEQFGEEGVIPFLEFVKMTLQPNESEISQ